MLPQRDIVLLSQLSRYRLGTPQRVLVIPLLLPQRDVVLLSQLRRYRLGTSTVLRRVLAKLVRMRRSDALQLVRGIIQRIFVTLRVLGGLATRFLQRKCVFGARVASLLFLRTKPRLELGDLFLRHRCALLHFADHLCQGEGLGE